MDRRVIVALRVVAMIVAALCVVTLAAAGTARSTMLNRRYYEVVLDDEDAYDRLYDEVLVDPAAADLTRDLLARLPVPKATVLSNLKIVLPPATLRRLVDEQITHAIDYLRGRTSTLGLRVDLTPVLQNVNVLAEIYLGDLVASLQNRASPDFPAFLKTLDAALDDLAAGQRPSGLPTVRLDANDQATALQLLLQAVPTASRAAVRPQLVAALRTGDIASALATVGPFVLSDRTADARRDLVLRAGEGEWDVVPDLEQAGVHLGAVRTARSFTRLALGPVQALAVVLGLGALAFLWFSCATQTHRRLRTIGAVLAAGGTVTVAVLLLARWRMDDLMHTPPAGWPPSVRSLVADLQHRGAQALLGAGLLAAALPLIVGVLLFGGSWLWQRFASGLRVAFRYRVALLSGLGVLVAAVLVGGTFAPALAGHNRTRCLGSTAMCKLRYDQAAYLATHNSMSTTADRFIGPLQDPDIVSQLDEGARALLIDTHTWERPDEIAAKLARDPDFPPDLKAKLPSLINRLNPPRPGLWLCHAVCRAGATPLVATLRQLGAWLDANRGEVVTLIIQDDISGEQTEQAFASAGLDRLIFTPSPDPSAKWPTLGEMVRENRRLVVFAENAQGPAPWYRNFYHYGMETPFAFTSPAAMSCVPNRGGQGKRLFLLNHFITTSGGSRLGAGEVNSKRFVLDRVHRCQAQRHSDVNFVAVDYATIGDAQGAVDALNAERLER